MEVEGRRSIQRMDGSSLAGCISTRDRYHSFPLLSILRRLFEFDYDAEDQVRSRKKRMK